jgi:hypothetical protein
MASVQRTSCTLEWLAKAIGSQPGSVAQGGRASPVDAVGEAVPLRLHDARVFGRHRWEIRRRHATASRQGFRNGHCPPLLHRGTEGPGWEALWPLTTQSRCRMHRCRAVSSSNSQRCS